MSKFILSADMRQFKPKTLGDIFVNTDEQSEEIFFFLQHLLQ